MTTHSAFILNSIIVLPFTWQILLLIVIILLLLLLSGLVSASEVGFFSLSPNDLDLLEHDDSHQYDRVKALSKKPETLLATILISNNLVNVAIIILSAYCLHHLFDFSQMVWLGVFIETVLITFLLLLFGEIMPKIYATQQPLKTIRFNARLLQVAEVLFRPLSKLLVNSTGIINKMMANHQYNNISMDDLQQALELTNDSIDDEKDILKGIATFGDTDVEAIMTSRLDMLTIDINTPYTRVLEIINDNNFSRIPVYLKNTDNIRGILYIKDLIPHLDKGNNFKWQTLIRSPFFVPETKKIDDLLQEFQKTRTHIAIVVDEYGGTSGIVTMEDILEEVLGDIKDEYDDEQKLYTQIDAQTFLFEAKILLTDFYRITFIDPAVFEHIAAEVETLAGLLLELKGDFPKKDEVINYKNYQFTIVAVDQRRIQKVQLHILHLDS